MIFLGQRSGHRLIASTLYYIHICTSVKRGREGEGGRILSPRDRTEGCVTLRRYQGTSALRYCQRSVKKNSSGEEEEEEARGVFASASTPRDIITTSHLSTQRKKKQQWGGGGGGGVERHYV